MDAADQLHSDVRSSQDMDKTVAKVSMVSVLLLKTVKVASQDSAHVSVCALGVNGLCTFELDLSLITSERRDVSSAMTNFHNRLLALPSLTILALPLDL